MENRNIKMTANDYIKHALVLEKKGQFAEAVTAYNQAIALNPKNATFYHNRGFALNNQGKLDEAIVDYNQAIKLDPKNAAFYYNRGYVFLYSRLSIKIFLMINV